MAKVDKVIDHQQALSVYFRDMLAEPQSRSQVVEAAPTRPPATGESMVEPPAPSPADSEQHKLLLCDIAGIAVAVPVAVLDNILRWPEQPLTRLPGEPDWLLGVCSQRQVHTRVIDVSHLLAPDSATVPSAGPGYILLVADRRWGIVCNRIRKIVTLRHGDINWRGDVKQRPWFRGVVTDSMSSVLDIDSLLAALQRR